MAVMSSQELWRLAGRRSAETGTPIDIVYAMLLRESGGDPSAVGRHGELGLMQVKPDTGWEMGVLDPRTLHDPEIGSDAGARYLAKQRERFGSMPLALSAYNRGPGATARAGGVHPEARGYVDAVMSGASGAELRRKGLPGMPDPYAGLGPRTIGWLESVGVGGIGPRGGGGVPVPPAASVPGGPPADVISSGPITTAGATGAPGEPPPGAPPGPEPYASPPPPGPSADTAPASPGPGGQAPAKKLGFWEKAQKYGPLIGAMLGSIGGRRTPMGSVAAGMLKRQGDMAMSKWEKEQQLKFQEQKIDMENARAVMEELQGLDLNDILREEKDPERRAALQAATDKIDEVAAKWAEMLDPESEGGSAVTPSEARKLLEARSRISREVAMIREVQKDRDTAREYSKYAEMEQARAKAANWLDIQKDSRSTWVEVEGIRMRVQDAAKYALMRAQEERAKYYAERERNPSRARSNVDTFRMKALVTNLSKVAAGMMMDARMFSKDPAEMERRMADYQAVIEEIKRYAEMDITPDPIEGAGAGGAGTPDNLGGGLTGEDF